ncbi:hypothetical protein NDU88_001829 [Pleurodeles waltl]|uniref:Uncharacterized protein n=1 Tax=Pleurodeles waltl TaxID=8319 RepID=A0AAV7UVB9_PLEWA|nr:hypothetical protein NDU88_001829 [Pleurodeles waltl]
MCAIAKCKINPRQPVPGAYDELSKWLSDFDTNGVATLKFPWAYFFWLLLVDTARSDVLSAIFADTTSLLQVPLGLVLSSLGGQSRQDGRLAALEECSRPRIRNLLRSCRPGPPRTWQMGPGVERRARRASAAGVRCRYHAAGERMCVGLVGAERWDRNAGIPVGGEWWETPRAEEVRAVAHRSTRCHCAGRGNRVIVRSDGTLSLERRRQEHEEAKLLLHTVTLEPSSRSGYPCVVSGFSPEGEAVVT